MQELKLRTDIFDKLLNKEKYSTSRLGIRDTITLGPLRFIETDGYRYKDVFVTEIRAIKFNDLTLKEAQDEGYSTAEEFKDVLVGIYGDEIKTSYITIIRFDFEMLMEKD